jgi:superfamily II DNA helicase RecQ
MAPFDRPDLVISQLISLMNDLPKQSAAIGIPAH